MPKTKFQNIIFTLIMAFIMVYAMICYNISLNKGQMSNEVFLLAFHEMVIMWPAAFILEFFAFSNRIGLLSEKLALSSVFQLVSVIKDLSKNAEIITSQNTPPEIVTAIDYINNHYKEDINLDIITEVVHISKYHFSRLFHKATGATFLQYLYNVRLVNVHSLLAETNLNLNEIAIRTGFSSSAHLSRIFKQVYNVSPQKFRRMLKEKSKKQ